MPKPSYGRRITKAWNLGGKTPQKDPRKALDKVANEYDEQYRNAREMAGDLLLGAGRTEAIITGLRSGVVRIEAAQTAVAKHFVASGELEEANRKLKRLEKAGKTDDNTVRYVAIKKAERDTSCRELEMAVTGFCGGRLRGQREEWPGVVVNKDKVGDEVFEFFWNAKVVVKYAKGESHRPAIRHLSKVLKLWERLLKVHEGMENPYEENRRVYREIEEVDNAVYERRDLGAYKEGVGKLELIRKKSENLCKGAREREGKEHKLVKAMRRLKMEVVD